MVPPTRPTPRGERIRSVLLVDDEEDLLLSLKDVFESAMPGLIVRIASSGEEALRILEAGERPEIIVSDYRMPGMNGIEFLREAEKLVPGVPRLMITAYASPELAVAAAREGGAVMLIAKPFDIGYFVDVVRVATEPSEATVRDALA